MSISVRRFRGTPAPVLVGRKRKAPKDAEDRRVVDQCTSNGNASSILMDFSPESLRNETDRNLRRHNRLDVCPSGKPLLYVCVRLNVSVLV
jgi:hypothetical protein